MDAGVIIRKFILNGLVVARAVFGLIIRRHRYIHTKPEEYIQTEKQTPIPGAHGRDNQNGEPIDIRSTAVDEEPKEADNDTQDKDIISSHKTGRIKPAPRQRIRPRFPLPILFHLHLDLHV